MTRLEVKLERISKGAAQQLPDEALEVTRAHTSRVEQEGRADEAVGEGDEAPDFRLEDTDGAPVSLSETVTRGPIVLSFYRGRW